MPHGFVEGYKDTVFLDGKAQQIGIGDLLVTEDAAAKGCSQRRPAGREWPVAIPWVLPKPDQQFSGAVDGMRPNGCGYAKEARFGQRADSPSQSATGFKPLRYDPMVDVCSVR